MKIEPVSQEVVDAITRIVGEEMAPFGLRNVTVTPGEDHDGDPILEVAAYYDPRGLPIDTKVVAGLGLKLRDRLWDLGETRFPHLRHHFDERQKVVGYP